MLRRSASGGFRSFVATAANGEVAPIPAIRQSTIDSRASTHSGGWRFSDNTFVERLWRSLKYEEIYLKAYQTVAEANGIACYFHFYIHELLHRAFGYRAQRQVFGEALWVASSGTREKPLVPIMS